MNIQILKAAGIHTAANELSSVPEGSFVEASNCVIRAKDVVEPRRGQTKGTYGFGSASAVPHNVFFYRDNVIVAYLDGATYTLARDTGSAFSDYAFPTGVTSFDPADDATLRMKGFETQLNFYFNTLKGVYRLDSTTGSPVKAGGPKPIDLGSALSTVSSATGFLANNARSAYRLVFGYKDANGTLHLGAPSGRTVVSNATGGAVNVVVRALVPSWVSAGMVARIYRAPQAAVVAGDEEPGDEMSLVYEYVITSSDVTAGTFSFVDQTSDDLLSGTYLYTNENSAEGILQANDPPPFCKDMALWNGRAWYANTKQFQRLNLELLGIGSSATSSTSGTFGFSGLRLGDVLTIGGLTYTAHTSLDTTSGKFLKDTSSAFASVNIASTARSLVELINKRTDNTTIRAYYMSGPNDPPGKILLESRDLDASSFAITHSAKGYKLAAAPNIAYDNPTQTVTLTLSETHDFVVGDWILGGTSHASFPSGVYIITAKTANTISYVYNAGVATGTYSGSTVPTAAKVMYSSRAWNPELPTSGTTVSSDNDTASNRIYYSKIQQPEAVPVLNYLDVGEKGRDIKRVVPLRDKLFVFKEEGVFIVSGEYPFRVDLLDDTVKIIAPDTAVTASNQIYALTNQGVVAVSDSGVQIVSRPIETEILQYLNPNDYASVRLDAFGVAHDSDRMYLLSMPGMTTGTGFYASPRFYAYNTLLGVWTTWETPRLCGGVDPDNDCLVTGAVGTNRLWTEQRNHTQYDYFDDYAYTTTVVSWNNTTKAMTVASASNIAVGDVIAWTDTSSLAAVVLSVAGNVLTLSGGDFTSAVNVGIRKAFTSTVAWASVDANNPTEARHLREVHVHFRKKLLCRYKTYYSTDLVPTEQTVTKTESSYSFDPDLLAAALINLQTPPKHDRLLVPQEMQRATYHRVSFEVTEAGGYWALNGITLVGNPTSERGKR